MAIVQKVENYIKYNSLMHPGAKIIVGVSGGADSVALLDILCRLGYVCVVAHCNFHLRDEESYRDEYFVEKLARAYQLEYICTHFDTKKHVKDDAISIEMAARELRYAWFEKIRKDLDADYIAVAHHLDDSIETVLINLVRGTGVRGLTGISNKKGYIVRPLLALTKDEVLEYLIQKDLSYVTDSTNNEDIYIRNKMRLNIIPLLETINPSVKQAISRTAANLQQVENIYLTYIESAKQMVWSNNKIDITSLMYLTEPKSILFEILSPYGFNSSVIDNIFTSIDGQSGKIFYSEMYRLIKDRTHLVLEKRKQINTDEEYIIEETDDNICEPIHLRTSIIKNNKDLVFSKNKDTLYLDKNKINYPLTIRRWQQGDWFIPFGMNGRKKLSDYFTDKKYSILEKENIWLLCSRNRILWIIGDRADNRCKVTENTQEIVKIEYKA